MKIKFHVLLPFCCALFIALFSCVSSSYGQTHQWVGGGGSNLAVPSGYNANEMVREMTTDANGNLYVLAETMILGSITIDTMTFTSRAPSASMYRSKTMLLSYNCNGRIRWGKLIEGTHDFRFSAMAYSNGSIYISGVANGTGTNTRYFGPDSTMPGNNYASWLIKYDTLGSLKWLRAQAENTPLSAQFTANWYSKLIMQDTLIHCIKSIFGSGAQLTPTVISQRGIYDYTYTSQGNLLSVARLPFADSMLVVNLALPSSIFSPTNTLYLSVGKGDSYEGSGVAVFDASRNLVRYDTFTFNGVNYGNMASTFRNGNALYTFGTCFGYNSATYRGQTFTHQYPTSPGRFGFVTKTDLNNNLIWRRDLRSIERSDVGLQTWYAGLANNWIVLTGAAKTIVIGTDTMRTSGPTGKVPIVLMDTTGGVQKMDYWNNNNATGGYEAGMVIASHNNNIYIGGVVLDSIWAGTSGYRNRGGPSDFFIAKYGYNCSCVRPSAGFTRSSPTNGLVNFTFTSVTTGIDSVRWHFGDGGTSSQFNPSHTFVPGTYNACVTTYNSCGDSTVCQTIQVQNVGISQAYLPTNIKVYPNPAGQVLTIESADPGTSVIICDIAGRILLRFAISESKQQLNISNLSPGYYLLRIEDGGRSAILQCVKE